MTTESGSLVTPPPMIQDPADGTSAPPSEIPTVEPPLTYEQFKELAAREPVGWWVEKLFPASGIVMVAGLPFEGKSVLMCNLVAAASNNIEGADVRVAGCYVEPATILYCHLEHTLSQLVGVLEKVKVGYGAERLSCHFVTKLSLDTEEGVQRLRRQADLVGADVIVIDSLRRATQMNENSSEDTASFYERIQPLTNGNRRLIVLLHHLSKQGNTRGSTDLEAQVESYLKLTRSGDVLTISARHHGGTAPGEVKFRFQDTPTSLVAVPVSGRVAAAAASSDRTRQVEAAVLSVLAEATKTRTGLRDAVRGRLGSVQNSEVDGACDALARRGLVRNEGSDHRHMWALVQSLAVHPPGGVQASPPPEELPPGFERAAEAAP